MKFIIISYYTKGTRYQQYADRLRRSLDRIAKDCTILYQIQGVENLGTWQKNTHYKAVFILEMLNKYGVPVLYVDADAVFHKYPALIDQLNCDMAAHFYQGHQLASGTLYFNHSRVAKDVIRDWIGKNSGNPSVLDQQNLQEVIEYLDSSEFSRLPPEYCKIFDLMPEVTDPVIEHFQASRELRLDSSLAVQEREKYAQQWASGYQKSICAQPLDLYVQSTAHKWQTLLDIGCGNGLTAGLLRTAGFNCSGIDITLAGVKQDASEFFESPVWQMPFADDEFDYTFSTDVLEHLPTEMVDASIQEIIRVSRQKTFHCIATFPHERDGVDLHLTVQPIGWWKEKFAKFNTKCIETTIVSREEFLAMAQKGFEAHAS
jgi:hypothetical protein